MSVRRATAADVPRVAATLASAFGPYAFVRAALPGAGYEARLRGLYTQFAELTLRDGELWVAGNGDAAAMWQPPGAEAREDPDADARLAQLLGDGLERYVEAALLGIRHRPQEPHFYLDVLGTAPERRRAGLGGALLEVVLDRCDARGLDAATDTSAPETLSFYDRHGFAVASEYDEPGGPHVWALRRAPRTVA